MALVNLIHETAEQYASKVLENKLYFFLDAHQIKMMKPLVENGLKEDIKRTVIDAGLNQTCREYAREYLAYWSDKFSVLVVRRGGRFIDYVVTLPERKEKVKKILEKLHYATEEE